MHATPLNTALTLCLTFLIPSVLAMPHQQRDGLPISNLPPAVWQMCAGGPNATIVDSSAPVKGTKGLILTTGSCIDIDSNNNDTDTDTDTTQSTVPIPAPSQKREVDTSFEILKSCPTAANNCLSRFPFAFPGDLFNQKWVPKCGASCSSSCFSVETGGPGPNPNHCQRIFDAMNARSDQIFVLEPNNFLLFTVGTCGTGIQNQIATSPTNGPCPQKMVYDYTDWAGVGNFLAWNCQADQGARGGICIADTGIYTNVPDFFIQSEPYDPYLPRGGSSTGAGAQQTGGNAKTAAIQRQIDDTVGIMRDNITKVAERGENLNSLQDKTDNLAVSAQSFRKGANRVRKKMWWQNAKWTAIVALGIILLLIIIIVPIVKTQNDNKSSAPAATTT